MPILKKIILSFLLAVQGVISSAQVGSNIPKEITLVCDNEERIERVNVALLMDSFGFFRGCFENWNRLPRSSETEVPVHGSVDNMTYLLAYVSYPELFFSQEPPVPDMPESTLSLLALANRLLLKEERMVQLENKYGDASSAELYSGPNYEKFLLGDRAALLSAIALDRSARPPVEILAENFDGYCGAGIDFDLPVTTTNGRYRIESSSKGVRVYDRTLSDSKVPLFTIPLVFDKDAWLMLDQNPWNGSAILKKRGFLLSNDTTILCVFNERTHTYAMEVWNIPLRKRMIKYSCYKRFSEPLYPLAISLDNKWFVAQSDDEIWVWSVEEGCKDEGKSFKKSVQAQVNQVVFSDDSRLLALEIDGQLQVFDFFSGTLLFQPEEVISAHPYAAAINFGPGDKKVGVITRKEQQGAKVYDLKTKQCLLDAEKKGTNFFFTADDAMLAVSDVGKFSFLYNTETKEKSCLVPHRVLVAASTDGKKFVLSDESVFRGLSESVIIDFNGSLAWIAGLASFEKQCELGKLRSHSIVFNADSSLVAGITLDNKAHVYTSEGHLLFDVMLAGSNVVERIFPNGFKRAPIMCKLWFEGKKELGISFLGSKADNPLAGECSFVALPLEKVRRELQNCSDEEGYLYYALRSKVKEAGHKVDRLSLSPELEAMFDRLPQKLRSEIMTSDGLVERVIAKQVIGIYGRMKMKQSSENKCRELQVYKPA